MPGACEIATQFSKILLQGHVEEKYHKCALFLQLARFLVNNCIRIQGTTEGRGDYCGSS